MVYNDSKFVCLDPSCFTSLENLKDTVEILRQPEFQDHHVIMSEAMYQVINYEPNRKFRELPILINDWLDPHDKKDLMQMTESEKDQYVETTRQFLYQYMPSPSIGYMGDLKKIGKDSIELDSLIHHFKEKTGKILFDILAVSWKYQAKIIAFSERTFDLMKQIGTKIEKGRSFIKQKLKERSYIKTALVIAILYMDTYKITDFIHDFQIQGILLPIKIIPSAGLIIIANG